MEADLEEQEDDPELAEGVDDRVLRIEQAEGRATEHDAGDELAEHRRLAGALGQLAEQLGGRNDRDQGDEKRLEATGRPGRPGGRPGGRLAQDHAGVSSPSR